MSANGDPRMAKTIGTEWKSFNFYDAPDHKNKTKDILKDEINNIAMKVVKARELKQNMTFNADTGKLHGQWRVGEIELFNKGFGEKNRYHNDQHEDRHHGLKFVSPPIAECSLHRLRMENEYHNLASDLNSLYHNK